MSNYRGKYNEYENPGPRDRETISPISQGVPAPPCCGKLTVMTETQLDQHRHCGECGQHYWVGQPLILRKVIALEAELLATIEKAKVAEENRLKEWHQRIEANAAPSAGMSAYHNETSPTERNLYGTVKVGDQQFIVDQWVTKLEMETHRDRAYATNHLSIAPWRPEFDGVYRFDWVNDNASMGRFAIVITDMVPVNQVRFWGVFPEETFERIEREQPTVTPLPRKWNTWYRKAPGMLVEPYQGPLSDGFQAWT